MTNKKLGVLLIDVPEPSMWKYYYVTDWNFSRHTSTKELRFDVQNSDSKATIRNEACKCTQEEAKKYPQFRWVALEELS